MNLPMRERQLAPFSKPGKDAEQLAQLDHKIRKWKIFKPD